MEVFIIHRRRGPGLFLRFWLALEVLGVVTTLPPGARGSVMAAVLFFVVFAVLAPDAAITAVAWAWHAFVQLWWRIWRRYF